jgi:multiple sugar transport system permease protein
MQQAIQPATRSPRLSVKTREAINGYLFALPLIVGFLIFTAGPMAYTFFISTTDWDLLSTRKSVGLDNYRDILHDDLFWQSLKVTFTFAVFSVPLTQLFAFAIALLLNVRVRGLAIFRTIFYLPTIAPIVASSVLWTWLFNSEFGLVNAGLRKLGFSKILWLQDPDWAMPVLILLALWGFGWTMIVYLAGLQGIPTQLYEAAEIDGARSWHKLKDITVPMMSPVIFFNSLLGMIFALQTFTQSQIITNGGPQNATLFTSLYIYRRAFTDFKMGYAAALAWVLFLIVLVLSIAIFLGFGRKIYYEDDGS